MQLGWVVDDEPLEPLEPLDPLLEPPELATGVTPESEPPPPPPQLIRKKTEKVARYLGRLDIPGSTETW